MRNAGITYLRRVPPPDGAPASEKVQYLRGHYAGCPDGDHTHHLLVPWPNMGGGQVNLSTQAGFALGGREDLALHWDDPWFLTVVH